MSSLLITGGYVCVHCSSPVTHLMKTYSSSVIKLVNCENCGNPADKYLEYDDVIILIDIILFNKQAYRHLLFNTQFQNHWKFALLILLAKTADEWLCLKHANSVSCITKSNYENTIYTFCYNFIITILGESLFFCLVFGSLTSFWRIPFCKSTFLKEIKIIWKCLISSSFGYFLLLPSLIWKDFQREIHLVCIFVYTLLSHIQAITVVIKIKRPLLAGLIIFANLVNFSFTSYLRWYFSLTENMWVNTEYI